MRLSRLVRGVAAILAFLALSNATFAESPWQQPAAGLASQIASILGHGSARLMIRNLSSLSVDEIPAIRKLLEQDLRARGVVANSAPNDTIVRVTLSESARGFTWVAEVIQGEDTQIAVVRLPASESSETPAPAQFMLRREVLIAQKEPVLDVLDLESAIILLAPAELDVETRSQTGWTKSQSTPIPARLPLARDPRGIILPAAQGAGFEAWLAGSRCTASSVQTPAAAFTIDCHASDDPWPLSAPAVAIAPQASGSAPNPAPSPPPPVQTAPPAPQIRAFYNTARDYFTGVVSPGMGVDLPPFYSAAILPLASGPELLISTVDGKVLLAANAKLTAVAGTSDWGSDFALLQSGCGTGTQIIASGAGDTNTDTLRAYQITGSDATPASAPLAIEGTVTALWSAPDGRSVLAVIRDAQNQYEVDRVTALCD